MSVHLQSTTKLIRTVRLSRILRAAAIAALGFGTSGVSSAADLFWDIDGATPGGSGTANAVGTWGTSNFWSTSSAGDIATGAWVADSTAVFSAGTDVTG